MNELIFVSQNIDALESLAGVPDEEIIAAHGTFMTSHCINCNKSFSESWMKGLKDII